MKHSKPPRLFILLTILPMLFFGSTNYAPADLFSGQIFYAPLDGSFSDNSGNAAPAANFGALPTFDRFGNANSAFQFDGVAAYATFSIDLLPFGNSPRTLSLWVKPEFVGQRSWNEHFAGYGSYPTRQAFGFVLMAPINGQLRGYLAYDDVPTSYTASQDWVHVVHTFDGSTASVYANGNIVGQETRTLLTTGNSTFSLGARYAAESSQFLDFYNGVLDDVRIWNRSLSPAEVAQLYVVPEPSAPVLLALSGMVLFFIRRKFAVSHD